MWVLGSSNIDYTYRVKHLPRKGQTVHADLFMMATGGKGANQAIAAAHWGAEVSFIGAVGDDQNGQILLEALTMRKVDIAHVHTIPGMPSGNAVILVDERGENSIAVYAGANQYVPLSACEQAHFREEDWLVAQLEVNLNAIEICFRRAKEQGCHTILNPSPYSPLPTELLENTEMIVANSSEAYEIGGIPVNDPHSAQECGRKMLETGAQTIVITLGEAGGVLVTREMSLYFQGHRVNVVDAQGAGDAFLGTLAARLSQGVNLEQAVTFAHRVAAFSVTKSGSTQTSLPHESEVCEQGEYTFL